MNRKLNNNCHSIYSLKYHLVLITKYRHECISHRVLKELKKIFTKIFNDKGCNVLEFGGEKDHVHILFEAPPQISYLNWLIL